MLNQQGHFTLMCGDGTNDVGSLKRADVGLAIVNNKEPTKEQKEAKKKLSMWPDKKKMVGMTAQQRMEFQKSTWRSTKKALALWTSNWNWVTHASLHLSLINTAQSNLLRRQYNRAVPH